MLLIQHPYQFCCTFYELSMSLIYVDADLGNKWISRGKLSKRLGGNSKLAYAYDTYSELGYGDDTARKLPNCNYSLGNDRNSIWSELKRNVDECQAEEASFWLIFKSPSIPFFSGRIWRPAVWTRKGLFWNLLFAFSAWLHNTLEFHPKSPCQID